MKQHLQATVFTLLERNKSQYEIQRLTGIDRKTIRRYEQLYRAQAANSPTPATGSGLVQAANSPGMATGFVPAQGQTPPPWPPAPAAVTDTALDACPAHVRSACEGYRAWIEEQVVQCGYCQPGVMMQVAGLLSESRNPNPEKIIGAMDDVICRCGTYPRIKKGIRKAAQLMKKEGK